MKIRRLTLLLLALISSLCNAQVIELTLCDSLGDPIYASNIYVNGLQVGVYNNILFSTKVEFGDQLKITSRFYEEYNKILEASIFVNDTARLQITLFQKARTLDEVVVLGESTNIYYDVQNSNVIDYYPIGDICFLLLKERNKRFIQLNRGMEKVVAVELDFKPTDLFLDGFGNFHIVTADSAYQIWSNEKTIGWHEPISKAKFNERISPIVGKSAQGVFFQKFESSNKFYRLLQKKNDSIFECYISYDKIGHQMANIQKGKIIGMYYAAVPAYENIIELGIWNGDLVQLQDYRDRTISDEVVWYKAACDNPVKAQAFGLENYITVIDGQSDSISLIDYETGALLIKNKLNGACDNYASICHDYLFDQLYLIEETGNGTDIYELNPTTGQVQKMKGIYDIPFVRNIKVSGEWVYYELREQSGFSKVLRQKIK
ncbi:MAG: hypothetical protein ACI8ZM_003608 [Crocinitomix sp.]|jgi:hypothetical protein